MKNTKILFLRHYTSYPTPAHTKKIILFPRHYPYLIIWLQARPSATPPQTRGEVTMTCPTVPTSVMDSGLTSRVKISSWRRAVILRKVGRVELSFLQHEYMSIFIFGGNHAAEHVAGLFPFTTTFRKCRAAL